MTTFRSWVIGRARGCDIVVDGPDVHDRHCQIIRTGHADILSPIGLDASLSVNGEPVAAARAVLPGDVLRIGGVAFRVVETDEILARESPASAVEAFPETQEFRASEPATAADTWAGLTPPPHPETTPSQPPTAAFVPTISPRPADPFLTRFSEPPPDSRPSGYDAVTPGDAGTGQRFGQYLLLNEIARGGMGVVFRARHVTLGRTVALKMILSAALATEKDIQRFRAEAEAAANIDHPNIVPIYEVGEVDGQHYFTMRLINGGSLAGSLGDATPPQAAARVMAAVARAVHAAHQCGILHRDLKPGNILIDAKGEPHVTDFGLAKKIEEGGDRGLTHSNTILGTPGFMAPEQAQGKARELTTSADIYGLGATFYAVLTGRPPFQGDSPLDTLRQVLEREPAPPRMLNPKIDRDLETVVLKCLEKETRARYKTAAEVADDLDRWLRDEPVHARRQGPFRRALRRVRKKKVAVALGIATLLVGLMAWVVLADREFPVPAAEAIRTWLDHRELSAFRPAPSKRAIRVRAIELRDDIVRHVVDKLRAGDGFMTIDSAVAPKTDAWTYMQAFAAILNTPDVAPETRAMFARTVDTLFQPHPTHDPFVPGYGWPPYSDNEPSSEANGWAISALGQILGRPDGLSPELRETIRKRYGQLLDVLEITRSRDPQTHKNDGGWNIFPRQINPADSNIYISMLVCQGLLDLRRSGVEWKPGGPSRDELLTQTLQYLLAHYRPPGWMTPGRQNEEFNDGLTLQIFALLLRAEEDGLIQLPDAVVAQIPQHLANCQGRDFSFQIGIALFGTPFTSVKGQPNHLVRPIKMLWYPWALDCATRWLERCERLKFPHEESVRARRLLGHLLFDLGDEARKDAKGGLVYIASEAILGLTSVANMKDN